MERNFSRSLGAVLVEEGGFANHPDDPGGPTMKGVTLANFRRYVKPDGTVADLKALTNEQAGVIYRRFYWDEVLGAELPDGLDHSLHDYAVHSGPGHVAKVIQRIVGVPDDGRIGPKTLAAIRAHDVDSLIAAVHDQRLRFMAGLKNYPTFGKGWKARVDRVLKLSLEMATQPVDAPVIVEKHIDVPVEVQVEVPVVPKGVNKRGASWFVGVIGILSTPFSAFFALDTTSKIIIAAVTVLAFAFFLWRGEMIIGRVKTLVAQIGN